MHGGMSSLNDNNEKTTGMIPRLKEFARLASKSEGVLRVRSSEMVFSTLHSTIGFKIPLLEKLN